MYRQYKDMTDEYGVHNNSVASIYCTIQYTIVQYCTVQYSRYTCTYNVCKLRSIKYVLVEFPVVLLWNICT